MSLLVFRRSYSPSAAVTLPVMPLRSFPSVAGVLRGGCARSHWFGAGYKPRWPKATASPVSCCCRGRAHQEHYELEESVDSKQPQLVKRHRMASVPAGLASTNAETNVCRGEGNYFRGHRIVAVLCCVVWCHGVTCDCSQWFAPGPRSSVWNWDNVLMKREKDQEQNQRHKL